MKQIKQLKLHDQRSVSIEIIPRSDTPGLTDRQSRACLLPH